jgi:catechol 2,3-dioxygenase-like lactoylglutathione lyase family enzyme
MLELTTVNIGSPDPAALARFYERLLGWRIGHEEPGFVIVRNPVGGAAISCQLEDAYVRPVWPAGAGDQQMQLHLEIRVADIDAALAHALQCGASLSQFQPQDDVRVCLDPDGHPFCLWVDTPD